jgi:two-component system, NarL family, sensor kinase
LTEQPRELTEQVLAAEQDERRRIALFLHDGPVQSLAGVALLLDAALDFVKRGERDRADEILAKALDRTRTTIGELRDLSFNLEPVVLRDHGFATAVAALAQDKGIEHAIQVELDVAAADTLGERAQAALYQIVREALEGAIRRGPPKTFTVRVSPGERQSLDVAIVDDAPSERRRRSIEVLEERARGLDAELTVEHEDHGTRMLLIVPVDAGSD